MTNERVTVGREWNDAIYRANLIARTSHTHDARGADPDNCAVCGFNFRLHPLVGESLASRIFNLLREFVAAERAACAKIAAQGDCSHPLCHCKETAKRIATDIRRRAL